jgi:hypothetical protein
MRHDALAIALRATDAESPTPISRQAVQHASPNKGS